MDECFGFIGNQFLQHRMVGGIEGLFPGVTVNGLHCHTSVQGFHQGAAAFPVQHNQVQVVCHRHVFQHGQCLLYIAAVFQQGTDHGPELQTGDRGPAHLRQGTNRKTAGAQCNGQAHFIDAVVTADSQHTGSYMRIFSLDAGFYDGKILCLIVKLIIPGSHGMTGGSHGGQKGQVAAARCKPGHAVIENLLRGAAQGIGKSGQLFVKPGTPAAKTLAGLVKLRQAEAGETA